MEKFKLGKTDLNVTRIGFGGIPIQSLESGAAQDVVAYAFQKGINFFDTARSYTTSEERMARALEAKRSEVILASKVRLKEVKLVEEDFNLCLQKLNTSYLDLIQLHNIAESSLVATFKKGGVYDYFQSEKKAGRLRYIGITTHRPQILLEVLDMGVFDTIQFPFNFIENEPLEELIPKAKRAGVGIIIMKPLAGGSFRDNTAALRWLLQFEGILPIPGMRSVEEIDSNLKALTGTNSEEDIRRLEEDSNALGKDFCRRCGYCKPCPNGISVEFIVRAEQFFQRSGWQRLNRDHVKKFYQGLNCEECGICEEKCPYNLPITKMIKKQSRLLIEEAKKLGFITTE